MLLYNWKKFANSGLKQETVAWSLVKQLILIRRKKCQLLWKPVPYVKRQNKEMDVIAHDIVVAEKNEEY